MRFINLRLLTLLFLTACLNLAVARSIAAAEPGGINVALAANGGVATSSSNFSSGTTPPGAINGDRKGLNWNNGGGWKSAAGMPQWLQVQFAGQRTIDRVIVYDVQDNFQNPVEPTDTMTNPVYGSSFVNFTVSAHNGADFVVVASVTGNNLVKRTVTFPAVTTDRIRVTVTASADPYARFTEVEAFTVAQAGPAPTSTTLASSLNPAPAGASVTFTATVNGTNPTGNVGFTDNGNPIAGCTAVGLTGAGHIRTAACSTSSLAVGTHPITASYAGDPGNAASASPPLSQVITAPPPGSINVALAANGGVATSSSNFSSGTTPPGAINGDRKGLNWNNGGGWKSAAGMPQWLQVQFAGQRTIDRVIVYDVQDNFQNPVEPTDTMTNPVYGSSFVNFTVSAYNGADFVVVASVTGNNLVKRTVTFPAVTTDRIRVTVTASADPYARFTEVEAWTVADGGPPSIPAWSTFGRDAQHTALSTTASQPLNQIRWQMPVDLQPQYSGGGSLLIHYGSPVTTSANTVIVPVKTGATGGFRVEARDGSNGAMKWSISTDYILPPHNWVPAFGPALSSQSRLYFPGAGGTVYYRDQPDAATGTTGQIAFYGLANYQANPQAYNAGVMINTPITTDPAGNLYFGFLVTGSTPLGLTSGIARISASGQGSWIPVTTASANPNMTKVPHNSAPALSADHRTLYVAVSNGSSGYLVALDSTTLVPLARVLLVDPKTGQNGILSDNGSASPTVGTDGDVYFGVLENPFGHNHRRGWLLHFNGNLTQSKTPSAFGWDVTVSLVPAQIVPSYQGASAYLLMSKYNHYLGQGGDGQNKMAILDPNATQIDSVTGATVMKEVLTILGPTPDAGGGVKEWCINTAVVDPFTKSVLGNNEDGKLYRWDLTTNTLSQTVVLTAGLGEAYTSTLIGPDGKVYATNNATLFAVGQ